MKISAKVLDDQTYDFSSPWNRGSILINKKKLFSTKGTNMEGTKNEWQWAHPLNSIYSPCVS
jgi:hypothetical protein